MGAWLAFAAFMEQRLADNAAERTQLERVGVVAKWALCWHHTRIGALFFTTVGSFLALTTVILAGDRAHTTDALVRFCRAYAATSGSSRERAE